MNEFEKLTMQSPNLTAENVKKIGELFPEVLTEALDDNGQLKHAIDFDKLKQVLSEDMVEGKESYEFTWVGKREAMMEAGRPTTKTLRPDKESSVNWDTTENIYIEGDNLEALKILQESYLGKIKMIYIDPPYNTGNDFVYNDSFNMTDSEINEESGAVDDLGNRFKKNESSGAKYHSNWLNMMYPRLKLARNLLREDGVIFISIDEKEASNLQTILIEIFGQNNQISNFIWESRTSISNDQPISLNHNSTFVLAKNLDKLSWMGDLLDETDYSNPDNDPRGPWKLVPIDANKAGGATRYEIINPKTRVAYLPPNNRIWAFNEDSYKKLFEDGRIKFGSTDDSSPKRKLYYQERIAKGDYKTPSSILKNVGTTKNGTTEIMEFFEKKVFSYPKPTTLIQKLVQYGAWNEESIILDFFSGSSTTANAVMNINAKFGGKRKFIMVQLPEITDEKSEAFKVGFKTIPEIGKERIRRAGKKIIRENPEVADKVDIGFKAFKIDDSNMKDIYYKPSEIGQGGLLDFVSNIKDDRTSEDLLYQTMLSLGMELSLEIVENEIRGATIYNVEEGSLIACFENKLNDDLVRSIATEQPLRAVFKESSFTNSSAKINLKEIFKELSPGTKVKVI